ncbi:hypothetical protein M1L60_19005 [Actinoplanes sp. TRM 88003]|uniref:Uncharacterized protein n=1 Tax=Paractinoplanes aksuensis TaxID=2939490 RepID=A0ABT1DPB2_9ACTN|nr:hypothetical protein [Actinoplanes aksuensis]MCO8272686.1 hypothetical protein [Actinoplanes aksuensis]
MRRDELIKALEAQPHDTDVQVDISDFLLDVVRISYNDERAAIVLGIAEEDLEDVIFHLAQRPWRHPR